MTSHFLKKDALHVKYNVQNEQITDKFSGSHSLWRLLQQTIAIAVIFSCENTTTCFSLRAQQTEGRIRSFTASKVNL